MRQLVKALHSYSEGGSHVDSTSMQINEEQKTVLPRQRLKI